MSENQKNIWIFEMIEGIPYLAKYDKDHYELCKNDLTQPKIKKRKLDQDCNLLNYGENFHIKLT